MLGIFAIASVVFLLPTIIYVSSDEKILGRLTYVFRMLFLSLFLWAFLVMSFTNAVPVEDVLKLLKDPIADIHIEGGWTVLSVILATMCTQICWMVHRLNHIGWPKWLALLITIPGINLVFGFLLTTMPGKRIARGRSSFLDNHNDIETDFSFGNPSSSPGIHHLNKDLYE
ncbi:DUF805 domain-containing protein [Kiloniella litopenaei]|uniref:DUF805 domain-containing protein n=1 Tax=Kiloniella litopenaei TaxID=1549748 RepID=UPI003BA940B5